MISFLQSFLKKPYLARLITVIVGVLCFIPSVNIPNVTDDKTAHFVTFAALGFLWVAYNRKYIKVVFGLLFYAIVIEIVQFLLPISFHRGYDNYDILADMIGVFLGLLLFVIYNWLFKKNSGN